MHGRKDIYSWWQTNTNEQGAWELSHAHVHENTSIFMKIDAFGGKSEQRAKPALNPDCCLRRVQDDTRTLLSWLIICACCHLLRQSPWRVRARFYHPRIVFFTKNKFSRTGIFANFLFYFLAVPIRLPETLAHRLTCMDSYRGAIILAMVCISSSCMCMYVCLRVLAAMYVSMRAWVSCKSDWLWRWAHIEVCQLWYAYFMHAYECM